MSPTTGPGSFSFTHRAWPGRVVFGSGTLDRVPDECERLGCSRALVLCTPGRREPADRLARALGSRYAGRFDKAAMHTPVEVTEEALARVIDLRADGLVAVGGGSTTGLAKALALRTDLPQIVVPTTYAGSEVTPVLGETRNGRKTTTTDTRVLPETVVYDVGLTLGLPLDLTVMSGVNAMAHAVESLYAPEGSPVAHLLAVESLRSLRSGLTGVHERAGDLASRSALLYGAWLAGTCLATTSMGLQHKLAHVLGGTFGLPHAATHTVLLPYVLAFNESAAPEAVAAAAAPLGVADAAPGLQELVARWGGPTSLAALGLAADRIDEAVAATMEVPYPNPREVTADSLRALLGRALHGAPVR